MYHWGASAILYKRCPWLSLGVHLDLRTPYVAVYLPWLTITAGRTVYEGRRLSASIHDVQWETDFVRFERQRGARVPDPIIDVGIWEKYQKGSR